MNWNDYIISDKEILLGKPAVKGTRISVEHIVGLLAQGWSESQILENYPRLTKESLQAVFLYIQECIHDGLLFSRIKICINTVMKLLANENFPYKSIYYLKEKGYNVLSIGIDNPGILDSEIMTIAINEGRTILTFDRDYGELIFRYNYKPEKDVIYVRLDEYEPNEPGLIIEEIITNNEIELTRALTVIDKSGIRQRKY